MPTQTFPCPFCAKKMGVGIELLGKKVRCPHCNQILVAPAPAASPVPEAVPVAVAPPPPPPPPPPPAPLPPEPAPIHDLPSFNLPTQEARESIFGEVEDESDDVFSSTNGSKLRVPEVPVEEPPPAPPPHPPAPLPAPVMPVPVPIPIPVSEAAYPPTMEVDSNPFGDLAFEAPPAPPVPVLVPVPVPLPPPPPAVAPIGATPPSSVGGNPWAAMDQLPTVPASVPLPAAVPVPIPMPVAAPTDESPFATSEPAKPKKRRGDDDDEPEDRPAKRSRAGSPASGGNPLFKIGFFVLAPYALLVTIAAIYGLFLKSSVPAGHPLSNLPDNFGEFTPAERKKTGKLPIEVNGELPPEQKVALGGKLEIGQLEVTPLAVEERRLRYISEGKAGAKSQETSSTNAIVLKLRIKNTSDDLLIHPLDPAFNRKTTSSGERVGTGLAVGKVMYWGGAIPWPFSERVVRRYEEAQAEEATPLKPGESRDYVVFTDASQRVVKAAKEAREGLLWRVQVRRGRMEFDGKDIPVTAIIGVEFKPSDVKTPD